MVPRLCAFNQSETASCLCARVSWRFPCSPALARDGELIFVITQTQFATQIQVAVYVTTKLYETSACECNNGTIFQNELFSSFLPSTHVTWQCRSLGDAAKVARWRHRWIHHFLCLKFRFCVLLPCQILWLYCKVVQWYSMRLVCIAGYFLNFSLKSCTRRILLNYFGNRGHHTCESKF